MVEIEKLEKKLEKQFKQIDDIAFKNQKKVLNAFSELKITTQCFSGTTGYGYDDIGRDKLASVYSKVFGTHKAIVTPLITCGSHAISTVLYGLLRPGDTFLSITGQLYDTLHDTIFGKDNGSLENFGIKFNMIELQNDEFDEDLILKTIKKQKPKLVFVQRSRGYSTRKALSISQMEKMFKLIKSIKNPPIIVVDNCYGEFVEEKEPTEVGADVVVGSLIKNPGGGLVPTGAYICGGEKEINAISTRFTSPSLLLEVGSFEMGYRLFYQGLFMAPHIVAQALKGALIVGQVMEEKGFKVIPSNQEKPGDIIKSVVFNSSQELIKFVQLVQKISPVDSFIVPMPWDMPGYSDQVIMAAGTFVSGASIELSCDSPIKAPYIAYFQGGLTYEHVKIFAEELNKLY